MNLDGWRDIADPTTRKIACIGDSTTEHGWVKVFRDLARASWGYGGYGVVPPPKYGPADAFGNVVEQHTKTGSWTKGATTDAWAIGFQNNGASSLAGTWLGNGAANLFTWTKPRDCPAVTGFKLLVADGASAGNFAYRIDGGAWTDVTGVSFGGASPTNTLKVITVNSAVTSTVDVRGANAAGTAVNVYYVGIEPLCATTGVKVHDVGISGAFLSGFVRNGQANDWAQWLLAEQPQLVFGMFINDLTSWGGSNPANWSTRHALLASTVNGYGGVYVPYGYVDFSDGSGGGSPLYADQADARARVLAVSQAAGGYTFNLDALVGPGNTAVNAAGFLMSDNTHPTDKGNRIIANHAWNIAGRLLYPKLSTR